MALIIPISFKESEIDLYSYLKSQVSPSVYIKQLLYKEINNTSIQSNIDNNKQKNTINNAKNNNELYNIYCFKKETNKSDLEFNFDFNDE